MLRLGLSLHQKDCYFSDLFSEVKDAVLDIQFKCTHSTDATGIRKPLGIRKAPGIIYHHWCQCVHQHAVTKQQTLTKLFLESFKTDYLKNCNTSIPLNLCTFPLD